MDNFASLQTSVSSALVSTTRSASRLASEDLSFHRALDSKLGPALDEQNGRLLDLATRLMGVATANSEIAVRPPSLKDVDSIEGNWRQVVDVVDSLLERADTALDEFTGAVKRLSPRPGGGEQVSKKPPRMSRIAAQLKAQDMEKPQLLFENVPTNRETGPFKPLLVSKPHAIDPLAAEPVPAEDGLQSQYAHPYQTEIQQYRYPSSVYIESNPIPYHPFESTTAVFVDSEEKLQDMLEELKPAKEIAIDLEHHDQRSYIGIVCLMQISTRDRDWIVDTLKPWRRKLQCLNEVFADPKIVKVLHGAHMDVVWLQRDLGLYLVGLFDTHYAARALGYSGGSLAFLLKKFADVDAQKQYQMADWRVRPLPPELFDYARSDTHYLLYIFDCMRNELIQRSDMSLPNHEGEKLWDVLVRSSETALQRYQHPVYDAELGQGGAGWYKMLSRTPASFTKEQFAVFRAVHQWRDEMAREQDDSVHYVMPNHQIFSIARELPTNRAELLGVAQPTTQTIRLRADELVSILVSARENGKNGPVMMDVLNRVEPHRLRGPDAKVETSHSVAQFLPKKIHSTVLNGANTSTLPLRSSTSTFWGGAFDSSAHQQQQVHTAAHLGLTVPLPPLTAEIFEDPQETVSQIPTSSQKLYSEEFKPIEMDNTDDDVFILKESSKKRRRATDFPMAKINDGMAAQSDEVAISDEESNHLREKAERKKAKKAKRAAKKAAATGVNPDANQDITQNAKEEAFDYATAPSILDPPRETREEMKQRKKKEVNPYAKALDAAKGLPRTLKEKAGKVMTYR